jgi:hypothetical protein
MKERKLDALKSGNIPDDLCKDLAKRKVGI